MVAFCLDGQGKPLATSVSHQANAFIKEKSRIFWPNALLPFVYLFSLAWLQCLSSVHWELWYQKNGDIFSQTVTDAGKIMKTDHRGPNSAFSCVWKLPAVTQLTLKGCKMYSLCYCSSIVFLWSGCWFFLQSLFTHDSGTRPFSNPFE